MTVTRSADWDSQPDVFAAPAVLTFLVSDIRGYTRYTAEHGNAAGARLAGLFLDICLEVMPHHGGKVFGTAGDQVVAAFTSAADALQAALALWDRLGEEATGHPDLPLVAGIGLDVGEAVQVGADYRGQPVNLASRLCSIAAGGEIFASDTVVAVAHVTEGVAVVDRGQVILKGLPHPVRVLQVGREGVLPDSLPRLQPSVETHPTNLPHPVTPFIGRSSEIAEITTLMGEPDVRLLSLVGPGGTGKTRLALQAATDLLYSFRDGAYFTDLSPLTDPALVITSIAETVGVKEDGGDSLLSALAEYLRNKNMLLVLDNWERVIGAAPDVAGLLDVCRELKILTTSRIPLHLSREREYAVAPFQVPDPANLPPLEQLEHCDAVTFFVERAGAAKHGFALTEKNASSLAAICSRLDGLPLALELAAARVKLFPPQALLRRLDSRLQLLTGGARDRPGRHRTLRGAIDWSYSLLTDEEQALFARLSVFSSGCSLEAAEAVCNGERGLDILEGIASLVDISLVRQVGEEEPRLRMLETIREYAGEKLGESGDEESTREAHALYFLSIGEQAEGELTGSGQGDCLTRLDAELDNLREAMSWLASHERHEGALRIAISTFQFWRTRGYWREEQRWLEEGLASVDRIAPELRGKAQYLVATLLWLRNDLDESAAELTRALELADQAGDRQTRAHILNRLGTIHRSQGKLEDAIALHEESRSLAAELNMEDVVAHALNSLGASAHNQGNLSEARQRYGEALALYDTLGLLDAASTTRSNLGMIALGEGNLSEAGRWFAGALAAARELGDKRRMLTALEGEGDVALQAGRLHEAEGYFEELLTLARDLGAKRDVMHALLDLGEVARQAGKADQARQFVFDGLRQAQDVDDVFAELWALGSVAVLEEEAGRPERAVRLQSAETAGRDRFQIQQDAVAASATDQLRSRLRSALGEDTYSRAWNEGQEMTLASAVAYALENGVSSAS